ncbi:hypothetical protein [Enterococcus timonensis]|uniref:hypothetical protein n=1 Tax=Enterococcus timonensis TaxID=1852364 RepID=UPI0008DA5777|nr:hypothetical protein [Enterococcus timonensis]
MDSEKKPTEKKFEDYNLYHDRGTMKWATAYAMEELVKGISANHAEALKNVAPLSLMTQEEVERILQESYFNKYPILFQLNTRDAFGHFLPTTVSYFLGEASTDEVKFGETWYNWDDIRHVEILSSEKWFLVDPFQQ